MKTVRLFVTLFVSTLGLAGNERGGGVPPMPIFMTEDTTYECKIELTQLGREVQRALVSKTSTTFSWKKGDYAGNRGLDLKDATFKHYELHMGPGRPIEKEVASAPAGATFGGHIRITIGNPVMMGENEIEGNAILLYAVTATVDGNLKTSAQGSDAAALGSKETLRAKVRQSAELEPRGDIQDQRSLEVSCKRIQ